MHCTYEADKNLLEWTAFNWVVLRPEGSTNNFRTRIASLGRTHLGKTISVCTYIVFSSTVFATNPTPNFSERRSQKHLFFLSTERMQLAWQSMLFEATTRTVWMLSSRKAKLRRKRLRHIEVVYQDIDSGKKDIQSWTTSKLRTIRE